MSSSGLGVNRFYKLKPVFRTLFPFDSKFKSCIFLLTISILMTMSDLQLHPANIDTALLRAVNMPQVFFLFALYDCRLVCQCRSIVFRQVDNIVFHYSVERIRRVLKEGENSVHDACEIFTDAFGN